MNEAKTQRIHWQFIRDGLGIFLIIAGYLFSIRNYILDAEANHRAGSLLVSIKLSVDLTFFLIRRPARSLTPRPVEWVVAIAGTLLPLLFLPEGQADSLSANTLIFVGQSFALFGVLSLNRSFGIVPANRGIRDTLGYKLVRHPIYLGYLLSWGGVLLNNLSAFNGLLFVVWMFCQVMRIFIEEKHLSEDPSYQAYKLRTRWRLLPGIF